MITGKQLYQDIWKLAEKQSRIALYLTDGDVINVIVRQVGSESLKITIDDPSFNADYADNGDAVYFDFDDILGYELR